MVKTFVFVLCFAMYHFFNKLSSLMRLKNGSIFCATSGLSDVRPALSCFGSALGSCATAACLKHQESDALGQYPCCG